MSKYVAANLGSGGPGTAAVKGAPATQTSYQLPDLPALVRPFELRTNRLCRTVSQASANWLVQASSGGSRLQEEIRSIKPGLLAALCFPAADAPQLRLAADVISLLLIEDGKSLKDDSSAYLDVQTRLTRARPPAPASFYAALKSFRSTRSAVHRARNDIPDLESYIETRREASGEKIGLALITCLGGTAPIEDDRTLEILTRRAADIIAWSWDILAFASLQSLGPGADSHNLVRVLMTERGLAVQPAVQQAGKLVSQSIQAFLADENSFLGGLRPGAKGSDEKRAYIRGLRDWIAGAVHWAYESELWVGSRGDELREFGWVFL